MTTIETRKLETRRKRSFFGAVFADPYRKLAAIALAIGLWYFMNDQITITVTVPLKLQAIAPDSTAARVGRLSVEVPTDQVEPRFFSYDNTVIDSVDIELRGPRSKVEKLAPSLALTVGFGNLGWSERKSIDIVVESITSQRALQEVEMSMDPPRVRLDVERLSADELPITASRVDMILENPADLGRLRRDTAQFTPQTARIVGPESSIQAFQAEIRNGTLPFKATIPSTRNDRSISVLLQLNAPPDSKLRIERFPSMTMQVLPTTQVFELEVPLQIDDLALPPEQRGKYVPADGVNSKLVRINAGGELLVKLAVFDGKELLREWAKDNLRLDVWIPPPDPGSPPLQSLSVRATLMLKGPLQKSVDRADCNLVDSELIPLILKS